VEEKPELEIEIRWWIVLSNTACRHLVLLRYLFGKK